jgi:hypothetical protein
MRLYAIRRRNAWSTLQDLQAAAAKSHAFENDQLSDRLAWIRSYVINEPDGTVGTICIYEAVDQDTLREHSRRMGMPCDEISAISESIAPKVVQKTDYTSSTVTLRRYLESE